MRNHKISKVSMAEPGQKTPDTDSLLSMVLCCPFLCNTTVEMGEVGNTQQQHTSLTVSLDKQFHFSCPSLLLLDWDHCLQVCTAAITSSRISPLLPSCFPHISKYTTFLLCLTFFEESPIRSGTGTTG